jgi:hypothetical protein
LVARTVYWAGESQMTLAAKSTSNLGVGTGYVKAALVRRFGTHTGS